MAKGWVIPGLRTLGWGLAGFWLVAAAVTGMRGWTGTAGGVVLPVLMAGNGMALAASAQGMLRGHRLLDRGAMAVYAVNAALSVTDQMGPLDIVSLGVSAGLLAGLVGVRART